MKIDDLIDWAQAVVREVDLGAVETVVSAHTLREVALSVLSLLQVGAPSGYTEPLLAPESASNQALGVEIFGAWLGLEDAHGYAVAVLREVESAE